MFKIYISITMGSRDLDDSKKLMEYDTGRSNKIFMSYNGKTRSGRIMNIYIYIYDKK